MQDPSVAPLAWGGALLDTLAFVEPGDAVAVLLRHSAREPCDDLAKAPLIPLTAEGVAAAEALGRRLPSARRLRLAHSWVDRCRQTAAALARGFVSAGAVVGPLVDEARVAAPYILDPERLAPLANRLGAGFVRAWADGDVPAEVMMPLLDAGALQIEAALERLDEAGGDELHVLVTHDWNVLTVREGFMGLRHERDGWPDFMEGAVVTRVGERVSLRWGVRHVTIDWPPRRGSA
jgi:hypothetical protein